MRILHNPRCRKSREAIQLLLDKDQTPEIIEYLKTPPSFEELKTIIALLGIEAKALLRTNEDIFKSTYKGKNLSEDQWIQAMVDHPKLIERPIVIHGKKAVIGRPPEKVLDLLA